MLAGLTTRKVRPPLHAKIKFLSQAWFVCEEQNKGSLESPTCKTTEAETGVKVENGENQENTMSTNGQNGVNEHGQQKGENSMDENENQNKFKKELEDDKLIDERKSRMLSEDSKAVKIVT